MLLFEQTRLDKNYGSSAVSRCRPVFRVLNSSHNQIKEKRQYIYVIKIAMLIVRLISPVNGLLLTINLVFGYVPTKPLTQRAFSSGSLPLLLEVYVRSPAPHEAVITR